MPIKRSRQIFLVVFGLVAFQATTGWLVLRRTKVPLTIDAAGYYAMSESAAHYAQDLVNSKIRPPLPLFIGSLWVRICPEPDFVSLGVNLTFLVCLLFSVHAIARRILKNERAALAAAVMCALYPIVMAQTRVFMTDLALTAMVALFYAFLLGSNFLEHRWSAALTGMAAGLGLLTKPIFPLFAAPGYLLCLLRPMVYSKQNAPLRTIAIHLAASLMLAGLLSGWWYATNWNDLSTNFQNLAGPATWDTYAEHAAGYLTSLWKEQLGIGLTLVLPLLALVRGGSVHYRSIHAHLLLLWVLVPYFFLPLFFNMFGRFVMPCLPALAILSAAALLPWRRRLSPGLFAAIVLFGVGQDLFLSFCPLAGAAHPVIADKVHVRRCTSPKRLIAPDYPHYGLYQAEPDDWGRGRITRVLRRCATPQTHVVFIACPNLLTDGFELHLARQGIVVRSDEDRQRVGPQLEYLHSHRSQPHIIVISDFLHVPPGGAPARDAWNDVLQRHERYTKLESIRLPDGTTAFVLGANLPCLEDRSKEPPVQPADDAPTRLLIDAGASDDRWGVGGIPLEDEWDPHQRVPEGIPAHALSTARYDSSTYCARLRPGPLDIDLVFRETHHPDPGQRVFDVYLQRQLAVADLDIAREVGRGPVLVKRLNASLAGSDRLGLIPWVIIRFQSKVDWAKINAIKIAPGPTPEQPKAP